MKKHFFLIIIVSLFLFTGTGIAQNLSQDALILFASKEYDVLKTNLHRLKNIGVEAKFVYPPNLIIASINNGIEKNEYETYGIEEIVYDIANLNNYDTYRKDIIDAIFSWNNNFKGMAEKNGLTPPKDYVEPEHILDDMRIPDKSAYFDDSIESKPFGAGFWDVSEYMAGYISVTVILPESDGSIDPSTEDWTAARESQVASEIQGALNWWNNRNSNVNLTYVINFIYGRTTSNAQTGYEPITRSSSQDYLWINEIMDNLGYTSYSGKFAKTTAFINDKIEQDDTDWGILVFVADSYNDQDGEFSDGSFAYAYLGGPYSMMTYDNNNYSISSMDAVMAHELGHIFFATDEYAQYDGNNNYIPLNQLPLQYQRTGYYNIENTNYEDENGNAPEVSIMRGQIAPYTSGSVSITAKKMLGWRDTDSDNIIDVLDTEPITSLNSIPSNPVYLKLVHGNNYLNPLNNQNPLVPTYSSGNDITINKAGVEYNINGLGWNNYGIIINDNNDFVVGPFVDGNHTVQVRATNSAGNVDGTPESFTRTFVTELRSLSSSATATGGSRKVWSNDAWDPNNFFDPNNPGYRVVYEDNGDIYLTEYVLGASPGYLYWTNEILISDGSGNSKYPSMTVAGGGYGYSASSCEYCIVWQQYDPSSGKYKIVYREFNTSAGDDPHILTDQSTSPNSKPVVGVSSGTIGWNYGFEWHFIWDNGNGLKYAFNEWDIYDIPTTNSYSHSPTITNDANKYFGYVAYAWQQGTEICYQIIDRFSEPTGYPVENITSSYSHMKKVYNPTIAYSNGKIFLAWQGESDDSVIQPPPVEKIRWPSHIYARVNDVWGSGWGILKRFDYSTTHGITPSGGTVGYGSYSLMWKAKNTNTIAKIDYVDNEGWDANSEIETFTSSGNNNPSISTGSGIASAIWSKNSSAPYQIHHQELDNPTKNKQSGYTKNRIYRKSVMDLNNIDVNMSGSVSVIIGEPKNPENSRITNFNPDTLINRSFMSSPLFTPNLSNASVKLFFGVYGEDLNIDPVNVDPKLELFQVVLKTVDDKVFRTVKTFRVKDIKPDTSSKYLYRKDISLSLNQLIGKSVRVDVEFLPNSKIKYEPAFVEIFQMNPDKSVKENDGNISIASNNKAHEELFIDKFKLHAAYPNPFNPVAKITFDIPEQSEIHLRVYDIQGQMITELFNGNKNEGRYIVEFDGSSYSSGTYFYELSAHAKSSGKSFKEVKKMMLVK